MRTTAGARKSTSSLPPMMEHTASYSIRPTTWSHYRTRASATATCPAQQSLHPHDTLSQAQNNHPTSILKVNRVELAAILAVGRVWQAALKPRGPWPAKVAPPLRQLEHPPPLTRAARSRGTSLRLEAKGSEPRGGSWDAHRDRRQPCVAGALAGRRAFQRELNMF